MNGCALFLKKIRNRGRKPTTRWYEGLAGHRKQNILVRRTPKAQLYFGWVNLANLLKVTLQLVNIKTGFVRHWRNIFSGSA